MTLQDQYNKIKKGKGSKYIFLKEAKQKHPNLLTNPMGFNEVTNILKNKSIIVENYVDEPAVTSIHPHNKASWENKFSQYLNENEEKDIKSVAKKTDKSVEELSEKNFENTDEKNLDNQIGHEVFNGIYFEAKQNPDKTLEEIRKIVSKNLSKDGQYYMKNAAFGVDGLGYEEPEQKQVTGKYASSGYSEKLKKLVKESLKGAEKIDTGIKADLEGSKLLHKHNIQATWSSKNGHWLVTNKQDLKKIKKLLKESLSKKGIHDKDIISNFQTHAGLRENMSPQEKYINSNKYLRRIFNTLDKYDISYEEFIKMAETDNLTSKELDDLDYVEDRIETHLSLRETWETTKPNPADFKDDEDFNVPFSDHVDFNDPIDLANYILADLDVAQDLNIYEPEELANSYSLEDLQDMAHDINSENQALNESKKSKLDNKLSEIDKQFEIQALESKIEAIDEMIESKTNRLNMIDEDESISELVDKKKVKELKRSIKLLEKQKSKMEKLYEKKNGGAKKKEVIDEDDDIENTTSNDDAYEKTFDSFEIDEEEVDEGSLKYNFKGLDKDFHGSQEFYRNPGNPDEDLRRKDPEVAANHILSKAFNLDKVKDDNSEFEDIDAYDEGDFEEFDDENLYESFKRILKKTRK